MRAPHGHPLQPEALTLYSHGVAPLHQEVSGSLRSYLLNERHPRCARRQQEGVRRFVGDEASD
jgi:hypothetical protein